MEKARLGGGGDSSVVRATAILAKALDRDVSILMPEFNLMKNLAYYH